MFQLIEITLAIMILLSLIYDYKLSTIILSQCLSIIVGMERIWHIPIFNN
jgi:hypothetical protein